QERNSKQQIRLNRDKVSFNGSNATVKFGRTDASPAKPQYRLEADIISISGGAGNKIIFSSAVTAFGASGSNFTLNANSGKNYQFLFGDFDISNYSDVAPANKNIRTVTINNSSSTMVNYLAGASDNYLNLLTFGIKTNDNFTSLINDQFRTNIINSGIGNPSNQIPLGIGGISYYFAAPTSEEYDGREFILPILNPTGLFKFYDGLAYSGVYDDYQYNVTYYNDYAVHLEMRLAKGDLLYNANINADASERPFAIDNPARGRSGAYFATVIYSSPTAFSDVDGRNPFMVVGQDDTADFNALVDNPESHIMTARFRNPKDGRLNSTAMFYLKEGSGDTANPFGLILSGFTIRDAYISSTSLEAGKIVDNFGNGAVLRMIDPTVYASFRNMVVLESNSDGHGGVGWVTAGTLDVFAWANRGQSRTSRFTGNIATSSGGVFFIQNASASFIAARNNEEQNDAAAAALMFVSNSSLLGFGGALYVDNSTAQFKLLDNYSNQTAGKASRIEFNSNKAAIGYGGGAIAAFSSLITLGSNDSAYDGGIIRFNANVAAGGAQTGGGAIFIDENSVVEIYAKKAYDEGGVLFTGNSAISGSGGAILNRGILRLHAINSSITFTNNRYSSGYSSIPNDMQLDENSTTEIEVLPEGLAAFNSGISGTGDLKKLGGGLLILSGNSAGYGGTFEVADGTVNVTGTYFSGITNLRAGSVLNFSVGAKVSTGIINVIPQTTLSLQGVDSSQFKGIINLANHATTLISNTTFGASQGIINISAENNFETVLRIENSIINSAIKLNTDGAQLKTFGNITISSSVSADAADAVWTYEGGGSQVLTGNQDAFKGAYVQNPDSGVLARTVFEDASTAMGNIAINAGSLEFRGRSKTLEQGAGAKIELGAGVEMFINSDSQVTFNADINGAADSVIRKAGGGIFAVESGGFNEFKGKFISDAGQTIMSTIAFTTNVVNAGRLIYRFEQELQAYYSGAGTLVADGVLIIITDKTDISNFRGVFENDNGGEFILLQYNAGNKTLSTGLNVSISDVPVPTPNGPEYDNRFISKGSAVNAVLVPTKFTGDYANSVSLRIDTSKNTSYPTSTLSYFLGEAVFLRDKAFGYDQVLSATSDEDLDGHLPNSAGNLGVVGGAVMSFSGDLPHFGNTSDEYFEMSGGKGYGTIFANDASIIFTKAGAQKIGQINAQGESYWANFAIDKNSTLSTHYDGKEFGSSVTFTGALTIEGTWQADMDMGSDIYDRLYAAKISIGSNAKLNVDFINSRYTFYKEALIMEAAGDGSIGGSFGGQSSIADGMQWVYSTQLRQQASQMWVVVRGRLLDADEMQSYFGNYVNKLSPTEKLILNRINKSIEAYNAQYAVGSFSGYEEENGKSKSFKDARYAQTPIEPPAAADGQTELTDYQRALAEGVQNTLWNKLKANDIIGVKKMLLQMSGMFYANALVANAVSYDNDAFFAKVTKDSQAKEIWAYGGYRSNGMKSDYTDLLGDFTNTGMNFRAGMNLLKTDNIIAGAFFNYGSNKFKQTNDIADISEESGGVYSGLFIGWTSLKVMVSVGMQNFAVTREVESVGSYEAQFNAAAFKGAAELTQKVFEAKSFDISAVVGANGGYLENEDVNEKSKGGDDGLAAHISKTDYLRFDAIFGLQASGSLQKAHWYVKTYVDMIMAGDKPSYYITLEDAKIDGTPLAKNNINAAAGFERSFGESFSLSADGIVTMGGKVGYGLNFGGKFRF
ncbi:MAG: autotransporter outer membrane beta-barrel domain-containing protein, partial [Elusimicrobiota bacterium]|nr:autotransporter outer membrane beta-barrel domain-containing protein [Elusimicrobiota bacterium]